MKILITGSKGFLGEEVTKLLNSKKKKLFHLSRRKIKKKNHIFCKLQNLKKLNSILNKLKPDIIVNLAAEVNFLKKTKNMHNVNALCPKVLAEYCKKNSKHLVHASGTIVNGIHKKYNSNTKFKPINYYGKSKLIADKFIQKINCKYSILRFGGIYGKNGPNHLGINNLIKDALKNKNLTFNGNPKSKRNYIFVNDAAKSILKCIEKKKYGIFYLGGEVQSFEEMIKKINIVLGSKKKIIYYNKNKIRFDQIVQKNQIIKSTTFKNSLKLIK